MGPDRLKHLRNIAILILLALAVWLLPGGDASALTISNILSLVFVGALLFLGYRMYMENREVIFGLEERQRWVLYAALALLTITLVATSRLWDAGGAGAAIWLILMGSGAYAIYGVWRAYRSY